MNPRVFVVDDHLLLDLLAGTTSSVADNVLGDGDVATTMSWYFRLGRAISQGGARGSLSRRVAELTDDQERQLRTGLAHLPEVITIVEARLLVPVMVAVADATRANLLTADAVATALVLEAAIVVSVRSALIEGAASVAHVEIHVLT